MHAYNSYNNAIIAGSFGKSLPLPYYFLITGIAQNFTQHTGHDFKCTIEQGNVIECIDNFYQNFHSTRILTLPGFDSSFPDCAGTDYWKWFVQHKDVLARDVLGSGPGISLYSRVRLTAQHALNGHVGFVIGVPLSESGNIPVQFWTSRVRDRPKFKVPLRLLDLLPAAKAVIIRGDHLMQAYAPPNIGFGLIPTGFDWKPREPSLCERALTGLPIRCLIAARLGLPLVLLQLSSPCPPYSDESMAVKLLADPESGFAPSFVHIDGLGNVMVARSDGEDFTLQDMLKLHRYNEHLMSRWDSFTETPDGRAARDAALSPAAYQAFE